MCNPCALRIDEHPKLMAFICTAVGIAAIGLILTVAFYDSQTMLGIGIGLGVLGAIGVILGCIHMQTTGGLGGSAKKDDDDDRPPGFENSNNTAPGDKIGKTQSIAPNKIPSPFDVSKGKVRGVDDDASPSPTRVPPETHNSPEAEAFVIDLNTNTRWGGQQQQRGGTSMYSSSNGSNNNNGATTSLHQRTNLPPGTIFSSAQRVDRTPGVVVAPPGGSDLVLSPFEKRSYPVPASLFPAPMNVNLSSSSSNTHHTNPNSSAYTGQNRSSAYEMDNGVRFGNGYDRKTASDQIRQNQDEIDAVAQYTNQNKSNLQQFRRDQEDADDDDALPSDYWQGKRRD